jgi:hypothetical protein
MEVAVVAFQVSSHTEVIFIFRKLEADSQKEVVVVVFKDEPFPCRFPFPPFQQYFCSKELSSEGGYKEMSSILADHDSAFVYESKCGELRGLS